METSYHNFQHPNFSENIPINTVIPQNSQHGFHTQNTAFDGTRQKKSSQSKPKITLTINITTNYNLV